MKTYILAYSIGDADYTTRIEAESWDDAECRLKGIAATGRVIGEWVQDAPVQEPVAYQYRMRPTWGSRGTNWGPWEECSKGKYDDCKKAPVVNDWEHESRALYTTPQPQRECPHGVDDGACKECYDAEALLTQALEALEGNHWAVADQAPHADVMAHQATIDAIRKHKGMT